MIWMRFLSDCVELFILHGKVRECIVLSAAIFRKTQGKDEENFSNLSVCNFDFPNMFGLI
jgi:hypothetical protein